MFNFRKGFITFALLSCFVSCSGGNSSLQFSQENNIKDDSNYRVMSFNIRVAADSGVKSWKTRKTLVANHVLEKMPDVVCMQEVQRNQYQDLLQYLGDYYQIVYYERESGNNPEGLAILFTKDFTLEEKSMFWLSETPEQMSKGWGASYYRICVNTLLKNKDGNYLNVYNVHLDHQVALAQQNGMSLILDRIEEKGEFPTVVMGDFNVDSNDPTYKIIDEKMIDCRIEAPETDSGLTFNGFGSQEKNDAASEDSSKGPIDHCFVSNDISPLKFVIFNEKSSKGYYISDHYSIMSVIECA